MEWSGDIYRASALVLFELALVALVRTCSTYMLSI